MLKLHDLNPDGVRIIVDWDSIKTGMSVFILCVNTEKAIKQIKNIVQSKRWKVETRVVIEDGKLGVRIWRVL
jgi:ethanolamine ammonia-lyase small subunit|tara:strand:+ start:243 stop:458 length:216 start_codon:yes stop_codon:yes gene_type:complete